MSNNPKTKAWRKRAERIASFICHADCTVAEAVAARDPDASPRLIRAAVSIAQHQSRQSAETMEAAARRYRRCEEAMRAELAKRATPALRVVRPL